MTTGKRLGIVAARLGTHTVTHDWERADVRLYP